MAVNLDELEGDDLRQVRLTVRKTMLANMLARAGPGLRLNVVGESAGFFKGSRGRSSE
jgi:hypothetical protein